MKIPVYKPTFFGNEKKYVNKCLDDVWISSRGEFVNRFEQAFTSYVGSEYSVGVSNGTVALHLALLAIGISPGDEVIVPTFTYISTVNAINYCGAKPIFVDSLRSTWQMDPSEVEKRISNKTKAILMVHLYGYPCDIDTISGIAKRNNLKVIEDCAEALGTKYKNNHVGVSSDVATFSFYGNKTITTGEGGMVITNSEKVFKNVVKLKGQGLAESREYFHDVIGYNYRLTNICAAIGLAQLEKIETILSKKKFIAQTYKNGLKDLPLFFHDKLAPGIKHSFWMNSILTSTALERDELRNHLHLNGIDTRPTFFPIHTMPMYRSDEAFPVADDIAYRGINLPSYPSLNTEELEYIINTIKGFYS